jgi:hypothetical protein
MIMCDVVMCDGNCGDDGDDFVVVSDEKADGHENC